MSRAYILLSVNSPHKVKETVSHLSRKNGVKSAEAVCGPYDIIAVIEGQDLKDLSNTVIHDLHDLGYLHDSTTCIVVE